MSKLIENIAEFAHKNYISEETVKELITHFTNDAEKIQKFILEKQNEFLMLTLEI
ncbi:hypothetical protein [Francisella orientalis]|uniref:hypothetical protein n=1 Tax=Francisella orientalis TaxID=299583 RepID=UPI000AF2CA10|nr:hypothetical protein [Francisella orientalis]